MKRLDFPPIWLITLLCLAYLQAKLFPILSLPGPFADILAGPMVGAGILATVLAVVEFRKHKTTINPHGQPETLMQSGIFKYSRNPIYLADLLILTGMILYWDAILSLPLVPIFMQILGRRFILPEEDRLRRAFRGDFASYCLKTRRWL